MSKAFARLAVSCVAAVIAATLSAQETTGSLSGNVTDASNAPLPGVTVEISGPALQGTRLAITTPEGRYRFLNLPPGDSTRSFQSLSVMTPGVSLEMADAQPGRRGLFATSPAVGSGTPPENNYIIEGMSTRYTLNGLSGTSLTMNFVQELQVLTGGHSAEWGRSTGGILNVVTKSGSNELHVGDEVLPRRSAAIVPENRFSLESLASAPSPIHGAIVPATLETRFVARSIFSTKRLVSRTSRVPSWSIVKLVG